MRPDQLERRLRERLDALGPGPRAELLRVLMLHDLERAERERDHLRLRPDTEFVNQAISGSGASVYAAYLQERIGESWPYPQSRTFAELLIDCEEDRMLRAVLIGMLRERQRHPWRT